MSAKKILTPEVAAQVVPIITAEQLGKCFAIAVRKSQTETDAIAVMDRIKKMALREDVDNLQACLAYQKLIAPGLSQTTQQPSLPQTINGNLTLKHEVSKETAPPAAIGNSGYISDTRHNVAIFLAAKGAKTTVQIAKELHTDTAVIFAALDAHPWFDYRNPRWEVTEKGRAEAVLLMGK